MEVVIQLRSVIISVFGTSQDHMLLPQLHSGGAACPSPNYCSEEEHEIFMSEPLGI